jgi:hypothetical protein
LLADFANFKPAPDKDDQHYLFTFLSHLVLALTGASSNHNKVFEKIFKLGIWSQKFKSQQ